MEEENPKKEYSEERLQESVQKVWEDYKKDQLDWLDHFYSLAGQTGKAALKKAEEAFKQLQQQLSKSHYNKNNTYFITFAKLQNQKFYRMKPYLPIRYLPNYKQVDQFHLAEDIQKSLLQYSNMKEYRDMLFENYKSVLQVLTYERYNFSNVAKHILRNNKESSISIISQEGLIFDVERGKKVNWWTVSVGLLYVFIRSVSKGLADLQSKFILHCDLKPSNILLFNCSDLADLSDPVMFASIIDKIQFKIIDFDHSLLLGPKNYAKTKDLIEKRDNMLNKTKKPIDGDPYNITLSDISKDTKSWIKNKHSESFVSCIQSIVKSLKEKPQQINEWIQMIQRFDDGLISMMEENIQAFKNKYR